jgi:hypothetical protein
MFSSATDLDAQGFSTVDSSSRRHAFNRPGVQPPYVCCHRLELTFADDEETSNFLLYVGGDGVDSNSGEAERWRGLCLFQAAAVGAGGRDWCGPGLLLARSSQNTKWWTVFLSRETVDRTPSRPQSLSSKSLPTSYAMPTCAKPRTLAAGVICR